MKLADFINSIGGFAGLSMSEQLRIFAWHLHVHRNRESIQTRDLNTCFDEVHLPRPANASQLVSQLAAQRHLLKHGSGFKLSKPQRDRFLNAYGSRDETVAVDALLSGLVDKVTDAACHNYLGEALICFRHKAFRAAVVMAWNVTYGHLLIVVAAQHLQRFNTQLGGMFGGKRAAVSAIEEFQKMKESEVIEVCGAANIVSKEVAKNLKDKLDKRNSAAHPSGAVIDKLQAEAYISDLINNGFFKIV